MLREFKFLGRNSTKNSEIEERENVPINPKESLVTHTSTDPTRAPLNTIPEPIHNYKTLSEQEISVKNKKNARTPVKDKGKISDTSIPLRTPEKYGFSSKNRFGWAQKSDPQDDTSNYNTINNTSKGVGGFSNVNTPKSTRTIGKANLNYSENNSTQSTPTKSVSKPPNSALFLASVSRPPVGNRIGNYMAMSKGIPINCNNYTIVNTVEVPHFNLKEDSSFWMEHNVQVVIRVRPLNNNERSANNYNRCLKQESAQCITWIGHPETRFTFDHVACETVDQETLFRMVGLPMVENCLSGYHSCVFAYGQTGSGKTHTMLGEMEGLEVRPSPNRGMTARIFEFLFARIRAEEEIRRDERLKYSCRCSFLEIYNEQITDLLEPSATNLQLREDAKNGVYVENLSEFEVETVGDILKLLSQGSSNRRVATTNMNRESSRSHSVFTCIIESIWEKDATTNSRFARMNLVDLAGSERQKSSGAEGERLKEAAGINKSLSTLGHVIMMLVDIAQGKPRHVPYRDSRLTFLLQDSLGGNSKTMIIANVSPSICCAAETLNTLKFAQRAKLIQNNAIVNEDSSGDVTALRNQIRQLKEELNALKRQNVSRTLSFAPKALESEDLSDLKAIEIHQQRENNLPEIETKGSRRLSSKQMKSFETTLAGALRREQMSEISIRKLEAEIEQLNRLVREKEEYSQCTKMMLKLREEKIQRMESLVGGLIPADNYLVEENSALSAEIKLLQAKVDKNPEVTRFAMEYDRVLEQVRNYQDFYEEGEREMLIAEVSELRNQLVHLLDSNSKQDKHPKIDMSDQEALRNTKAKDTRQLEVQLNKTFSELEECRNSLNSCLERNERLTREIEDLRATVSNLTAPYDHDSGIEVIKESIVEAPTLRDQPLGTIHEDNSQMKYETLMKPAEDIMNLELEVDILKQILKEERSSRANVEEKELGLNQDLQITKEKLSFITKKYEDANEELKEAKSVIEALESQQLFTINEIEDLKNSNSLFAEIISEKETEISNLKEQISYQELRDPPPINDLKNEDSPLVVRLKKMQKSLEKAKELNTRYQNDYAFNESNEEEMDEIRKQVEAETAEVIICLQDELADLQKQVQDSNLKETQSEEKIYLLDQDNAKLSEKLQEKEKELKELSEKWELLTKEIETGLQKEVQDSSLKETESEEKIYLLDQDNKILSEKLQEKEKELKELSENWELLSREIEIVLISGNEELEEASDQIEFSFGSPLKKEYWVSDKVEKIRKIITEKEIKIHELNRCLEDANYRTNDLEGMLRSLRGATLVITEAHQQECDKKEREIIDLNAELSSKAFMIEELENKIRSGKEQLEKTALSATAAFVIVKRLSEINYTNIDALDALTEAYQQECNEKQREIIDLNAELSSKAFMIEELENKIISGKEQLEKTAVSATAAFVIVNRLSEINSTNAYALTEKYQQACNEKQREIIDLNAELSSKAFMIEELENKIISGKEQLEKTAVSATAAFVIVNRLSEINSTNAYALTEKYQQACNEKQKEILVLNAELSSKAFLIEELENKIISGKELLDKTLLSATAAFVIVNRLSEVNSTNIDAFDALKKEILALNEQISLKAYAIEELEKQIRLGEELLEKTATSATVAFVIVNRLSEINSTNIDALKVKDENICNLGVEINGAETLIYSLRRELNISGESCDEIRMQLSIEQQRACAMENKLLEIEENEILKTSEKLAELKSGVSTLRSSMDIYASNKDDVISHKDKSEAHAGRETKACENAVESCALGKDMEIENSGFFYKDASDRDRDNTIILLRKEIESALESLKEVQAEMAKLRKEKEEVMMYERSCQESTKSVVNKLVLLKQAMSNFEEQIRSNMGVLDHKLLSVEDTVQEIRSFRCQEKELLESELGDAKAIAAQRSAEASCIYAKFEEAQDTVREADIMINELMIANETSKLKIKGMKKKKATLTEENGVLSRQVQSLQSTIEMKDLHYDNLEKKSISDLLEMNNLVSDLEGIIAEIQSISNKEFASLAHDFLGMKGQFQDSTKLIRSWVEEIWSEIVIKDCAVSVLHLCHMGLFLESVNGLNTENALLNRGLSESNSVINELKEYNVKSRSEIEMCRILKGKLLADMKKGLDRISKKEDETGELTVKLAGFQKKILDLQEQEELMLEKSDHMGFELSALMKELDQSNGSIFNSLQENENLLKNREEFLESLEENYMIDLCAKDFELFILASNFERETLIFYENFEKMKRHIIFSMIDTELKEQSLLEREDEIALLTKEIDEEKKIGQDLISKITERDSTIEQIVKLKEALESDVQLLRNSAILSENLKSQLGEVMEKNKSMLSQIENFEGENHRLQEVVKAKEMELQMAFTRISAIDNNKKALEDELLLQKASLDKVLNELKEKELELITMCCLKTEKKSAESESRKLKESYCSVFKNMEVKNSELLLKIKHCFDSLENLNVVGSKISDAVGGEIFQQISESLHITDNFVEELEIMENSVSEILTENLSLQTELLRKDDVLNGLLFDLHMLQESASSKKDQKDEIEELVASLVDLENELAQRTREHDEAVENSGIFEAELKEKIEIISSLRLDISKLNESINSLSSENLELTYNFQSALDAKKSVEEELFETRKLNEALEREHEEMSSALSDISNSLESFKCDLKDVSCERDGLQEEILIVKRQLEIAEALAEENEAIATEAQEIAESRKVYAEEKEDEIKLLEMSMEELGKTLDITGNKVNIIQEEAERQRLQREELEIELDSLRDQISNVKCVDVDMKRHLGEKERECQEALEKIQILEKEIVAKDAEISQCKAHITELNLHAEAQARDYKQNFKALESMAEQKPEGLSTHGTNSSSSKLEKNGSKPRGSGSPFKCIGLGLSQQIKSEKDEELNASRLRIEELEVLAANRQKEVFTLKAKLATTDSMTHDLLRELTGLKLNLNKYTYLLDNELLQKITEKPGVQDFEYQFKDQEVIKLKQQLSEFVEERKGWLEEIDKKQAEMVAAQVALEELRQRERLLSTENEMIKMEYANYKRKINELEMEIKKLSGQQNLQQRIHHHAKIKEENNLLKSQNEELIVRLRRMDSNLTRVKEVVAKTRLANGRSPDINFEEENRLNQLLKETEEERLQLAQKLVGLCTNILKAAGVTRPASNVSISAAEEALDQIKNRITSLERELQDAKLRNRISSEKIRLSELKPQNSPMSPKSDEYRPVFKAPHSPFLSSLDR